jgi:hypothetical protein
MAASCRRVTAEAGTASKGDTFETDNIGELGANRVLYQLGGDLQNNVSGWVNSADPTFTHGYGECYR